MAWQKGKLKWEDRGTCFRWKNNIKPVEKKKKPNDKEISNLSKRSR